jgi:hypothetical protein
MGRCVGYTTWRSNAWLLAVVFVYRMKWPSTDVEQSGTVACEIERALQRSQWSWSVDWVFRIANNIKKNASARQFSVSKKERIIDLSCLCQVT